MRLCPTLKKERNLARLFPQKFEKKELVRTTFSDNLMFMTYIQGSVDELPSGECSRSLDRPGAKTPRPYPRIALHQGSFSVSLKFKCTISGNLFIYAVRKLPVFDAISESLKTDLKIARVSCREEIDLQVYFFENVLVHNLRSP